MFSLMKSQTSLKKGHVGSKTSSLAQVLQKPNVCPRGHIQSDNHETWSECAVVKSQMRLKMGHVSSKTAPLGQMVEKPSCML